MRHSWYATDLAKTGVHSGYRPDVDGLRAIAVWLVILFHAGYAPFSGGFVGVDVFFVISGYLITGLIATSIDARRFSYQNFYLRRMRRLLPAYVAVLAVSFVLAYLLLLPDDFVEHAKLMAMSFASLGNFYIANTTQGYFAKAAEDIPLLHTWSLAVEEQFYLLWPALLVLLKRVCSGRHLVYVLLTLSLLLLVFSEWYIYQNASRAYYLLPARAFELMLGALLAVGSPYLPLLSCRLAGALGSIGLLGIIVSALVLSGESSFPGINALYPSFACLLLIYAGSANNTVSMMLATRPLVWMGRISYSLYLWHWVIFSFYRYAFGEMEGLARLCCIALALAAAHVTWRYIENPFRFSWQMTFKTSFALLFAAPFLALATLVYLVKWDGGMPGRFTGKDRVITAMSSKPTNLAKSCGGGDDRAVCGDILIIGDSHAGHFGDFFDVMTTDSGAVLKSLAKPGCVPLYGITIVTKKKNGQVLYDDFDCAGHTDSILDRLGGQKYVVLAGYWSIVELSAGRYYFVRERGEALSVALSRKYLVEGLEASISKVLASGAVPVIVLDTPTIPRSLFNCAMRRVISDAHGDCSMPVEVFAQQQAYARSLFVRLGEQFPSLVFVNPSAALCDEQRCQTMLDGIPIYGDEDHLNAYGSRALGLRYLEMLGTPFAELTLSSKKKGVESEVADRRS